MSYKDVISEVFSVVCNLAVQINVDAICSYRIKRIDSIIGKLRRLKGVLELDSMWDIAGCRCILYKDAEVYKLRKLIQNSSLILLKENNYLADKAKESGYRSLHLYVCLASNPNAKIEIQVRTTEHHDWATFVEMVDQVCGAKVKENVDLTEDATYGELFRLHQILSNKYKAFTRKEMEYVLDVSKKYNIIGKLDTLFVKNIFRVRKDWAECCAVNSSYFLLATNDENEPSLKAFVTFEEAERKYYELFSTKGDYDNIVIISMPDASFDQINIAYANYLLTYHKFTHLINAIVANYCELYPAVSVGRIIEYVNHFSMGTEYFESKYNSELKVFKDIMKTYDAPHSLMQEWLKDIKSRLDQLKEDTDIIQKRALRVIVLSKETSVLKRGLLRLRFRLNIPLTYRRKSRIYS